MPDSIAKVARDLSLIEKLKHEVSLVSHFLSDVLCYFDNNPDGTFLPKFHFREQTFLGFTEELSDSTAWFFDVLHPDDFQGLQKIIRKVFHGISSFGEIRLRDKEDKYHLFRIVGKPVWPNKLNGFIAGGIIALNCCEDPMQAKAPKRETIIDSVLSNYVIIGADGEIISSSGAASSLLGVEDISAITGTNLFDFFGTMPPILQNFKGSDVYFEADVELKAPAGDYRWLQVCIFPIEKNDQQKPQNFVVLRDITSSKNAEVALLESEEKFRALADNSHGVIFILAAGRIVYVNKRAKNVIGYEACEILKDDFNFSQLFNAANPGGLLADLEDELIEGESVQREVTVRRKDGVLCKSLVSLRYMPYQGKKAVLGVITDITALDQAHEKLDETKQRYWVLFEASSDAIFLESIDGTILDCNTSCERLYGYSRLELLGMNAEELVPDKYFSTLQGLSDELEKARSDGRPICLEALGKRKNGDIFPTEVTLAQVKLSGDECFALTIRDISARREIEEARQRYDAQLAQLQKIDSLGQVANGLANDFNNLLTGIMGYSDLMLRDLPASSSSREKAKRIIDATRKASEIIQQLMSYTGKMPSLFHKINMGQLVHEMMPVFQQIISENIVLRYELSADVTDIRVDPPMIKQALTSIMTNAFEAIDKNSAGLVTLSLKMGNHDFCGSEPGYFGPKMSAGTYVILKVADNGCGIESVYLNRIFDPFFSTKFSNRGLGLSSVLGMLRGHRGAIHVKSIPDQGTEISILLPYSKNQDAQPEAGITLEDTYPRGGVLIVDDEESVREILAANFREFGYEPFVAENAHQGLEMFKSLQPKLSLVILDLIMPETSGEELVQEIRSLAPQMTAVICTGCLPVADRQRLEKLGVSAFIEKPFITRSALEKMLQHIQALR